MGEIRKEGCSEAGGTGKDGYVVVVVVCMGTEDLWRRVRGWERYCSGVHVWAVVHVCFSCTPVPFGSNAMVSGRVCLPRNIVKCYSAD